MSLGSVSSFCGRLGVTWFIRGAPRGRCVQWGSVGSFRKGLGVVRSIWGR